MNIIDAIKSGKPFRRKGRDAWLIEADLDAERRWLTSLGGGSIERFLVRVSLDDLKADDWEIQEPAVTITRTQFWEAADLVIEREDDSAGIMSELAVRLGLDND